MREQLRLDFSGLTCAFGEPWIGAHPLCDAHGRELAGQFHALVVVAGHFDTEGYTAAERKKARR